MRLLRCSEWTLARSSKVRVAAQHEAENRHEQQEQGEQGDEAGEREQGRQVAGGVVPVLLHDREADCEHAMALLGAIDRAQGALDVH
jgi:hypothetical protein